MAAATKPKIVIAASLKEYPQGEKPAIRPYELTKEAFGPVGSEVYSTWVHGDITVVSDGKTLKVYNCPEALKCNPAIRPVLNKETLMNRRQSKHSWTKCAAIVVVLTLAFASGLYGQLVTGSILGTVLDSTGSAIPNASVSLVSESTGAVRQINASPDGRFVLSAVQPGVYTLTVEHSGFKKYERKSLPLAASEVLGLSEIRLEIGAVFGVDHGDGRGRHCPDRER